MDIGWCDFCLRVANVGQSRRFYEGLGFRPVEGDDDEGWAVLTNGNVRIGLFTPVFMKDTHSINFWGGDVMAICERLIDQGYSFEAGPTPGKDGGGSAVLRDPDGHMLFFDAAPGESMKDLGDA